MKVRVCGPNLSSVAQKRATFHVHADGCRDLLKYGPFHVMGGECPGNEEMLIDANSQLEVVHRVYSDQIDEAVNDEQTRDDIAADYISDFWFASCCAKLPVDAPEKPVYECWVDHNPDSFERLDASEVIIWARRQLNAGIAMHQGIHIVKHDQKEYS